MKNSYYEMVKKQIFDNNKEAKKKYKEILKEEGQIVAEIHIIEGICKCIYNSLMKK